ncbi:MAG: hypothetical protein ABFS10_14425, partial [Bacteroidota bacterium]
LYSLKTRQLLDHFKVKMKKELLVQYLKILDELNGEKRRLRTKMKAQRKRQRAEFKTHKRDSAKAMRKAIQKLNPKKLKSKKRKKS